MQPDDEFVRQVQDVLEHLYDHPYLQTHPLAERLLLGNSLTPRERMRLLRTTVLEALGDLAPGPGIPFRSLQARTYNVLNLRYVAGMTVEAVARELAVSERQLYRDLRKAEQDLAALLWARCPAGEAAGRVAEPGPEQLVMREAERVGGGTEEVYTETLLHGALAAVERLSQQLEVRIEAKLAATPRTVSTDRVLARQALVSTLSHALQNVVPGTVVTLASYPLGVRARVQIHYTARPAGKEAEVVPLVAEQLIKHLGGQWSTMVGPASEVTFAFTLGERTQTTVLVIDDHEGLHELFRRYLADEDYRLAVACNGREGLRLAEEIAPDIIVLDVMMPQEDGWEVLRSLHNRELTRHIPVIVCSVFNDPQLAFSLGAADFLAKPVTRAHLLLALSRCRQEAPAP